MFKSIIPACLGVLLAAVAPASARSEISSWHFNASSLNATTGNGVMTLIGGTTYSFNAGSPDPSENALPNNQAPNTINYPAQGLGSGTAGVEFALSTVGFEDIVFLFDQRHSNRSSKYVRVDYSTNGGATYTQGPVFSALGGDTWHIDRTADFSADPAIDNNPNVRIRIVSIFDPALGNGYSPSRNDGMTIYEGGPGGGTLRPDRVRVNGTALIPIPPQASGSFVPGAVCRGDSTLLTINATLGQNQNPPSTSVTVTANLTSVGGGAAVPMVDQGGNVFTLSVPVSLSAATGIVSIPVTVTDNGGRFSTTPASLAIGDCANDSGAPVVISMVYPAGGLAGSIFNGDFVELHNRTCSAVNINGWSLQYSTAGGVNTFDGTRQVNLSGSIPAGGYLLILTRRILETDPGLPFPAPDVLAFPANPSDTPVPPQTQDGFGMDNNAARLALCNSTVPIGASCASHPSVVDFVGYGSSTFCYEGVSPVADTGALKAAMRKGNGCTDSNQGFADFDVTFPRDPYNASSPAVVCGTCTNACSVADVTDVGDTGAGPDGQLTYDDLLLFINTFSEGSGCPGASPCSVADITDVGDTGAGPDGQLTYDDLLLFINTFGEGC